MKFFKFEEDIFDYGKDFSNKVLFKKVSYTHFLNVEDIRSIIISSDHDDYFILTTRVGGEFHIKKDYLDSLLKLVDIDYKEAKK